MRNFSFLVTALLSVGTALASQIDYTLVGSTNTVSFSLTQPPTPLSCAFAANCFSLSPVDLTIDGTSLPGGTVSFYESSEGGGVTIQNGSTLLVNNNGPGNLQLFTGSVTSPTLETFSSLGLISETYGSPVYQEAFTLTASSTVPEPASSALLACGLAAAGLLLRRRRSAARLTA